MPIEPNCLEGGALVVPNGLEATTRVGRDTCQRCFTETKQEDAPAMAPIDGVSAPKQRANDKGRDRAVIHNEFGPTPRNPSKKVGQDSAYQGTVGVY